MLDSTLPVDEQGVVYFIFNRIHFFLQPLKYGSCRVVIEQHF